MLQRTRIKHLEDAVAVLKVGYGLQQHESFALKNLHLSLLENVNALAEALEKTSDSLVAVHEALNTQYTAIISLTKFVGIDTTPPPPPPPSLTMIKGGKDEE